MDGTNIRQLREGFGITQVELAARLGYTQQYVSKVEKRERVTEMTRRIFERAIAEMAYDRMPAA